MVKYCCAYGCTIEWRPNGHIKFHKFPLKNPQKLKLWLDAVRRKNFTPTSSTVICSEHFKDDDYLESSVNKNILKQSAVPSIFNNFPQHMLKCETKRRKLAFYHEETCVKPESSKVNESDEEKELAQDVGCQTYNLKTEVEVQLIPKNQSLFIQHEKDEVFHKNDNENQQQLTQEVCVICENNKALLNIGHLVNLIQCVADVNITEFKLPLRACRICVDELDIAYKIRHKIIRRSQQLKKSFTGKQLAFTQTDNPNMITKGSQTDEFVHAAIPTGPKLSDLEADNELMKNLIIVKVDQQDSSTKNYGTSMNDEPIDQNSFPELPLVDLINTENSVENKENGNDDSINTLNEVEERDFSNLSHFEVKSALTRMTITNKHCIRCYKCFPDTVTLTKHIRKNCSMKLKREGVADNVEGTSEQERTCNKCQSIFRNILDLNLHKEFDHNNFVCLQCLTYCYNNDTIDHHRTLHKDEKKITCEYCDGTVTKTSVTTHIVAHAWNWWRHAVIPCVNCNELVLNDYKHKHRFQCPQKRFVCETCGYILKTLSSLTKHKLKHEKLYECTICLKNFFNKKDLIRHNQISHIIFSSLRFKKNKLETATSSPLNQTIKGRKRKIS